MSLLYEVGFNGKYFVWVGKFYLIKVKILNSFIKLVVDFFLNL